MANTIRIKRRSAAGSVGAPSQLAPSELAYNEADSTLYYGFGDAGGGVSSSIVAIAGAGAYAALSGNLTFSGTVSFTNTSVTFASGFTLPVNRGGTGASTAANARVNLLPTYTSNGSKILALNSGASDVEWITLPATGVTSVALSAPNIFSVSGSPVTSTGTLALSLANQTANYVWAGPTTGSATAPTFRALVANDIPALSYLSTSGGTVSGNVTVTGDLTIQGTTTTIDSTTVTVADKNIVLGNVTTPTDITADGGGITLLGTVNKTLNWVDATDSWTSSEHLDLASGKVLKINGTTVLSATALDGVAIDGGTF